MLPAFGNGFRMHLRDAWGFFSFGSNRTKAAVAMTKTIDLISDAIRNPKHPFRQVDDRPQKQKKHRYERRKIKEFIRMGDWSEQTSA